MNALTQYAQTLCWVNDECLKFALINFYESCMGIVNTVNCIIMYDKNIPL